MFNGKRTKKNKGKEKSQMLRIVIQGTAVKWRAGYCNYTNNDS